MADGLVGSRAVAAAPEPELFGKGQLPQRMQGHWVLARMGKRVLRPGGLALTRRMLEALAIGPQDHVVEFAPGIGRTAQMVLEKHPASYSAVERDVAAAENLRAMLVGTNAMIRLGSAEESGFANACATVVYGEAMLTMQTAEHKARIVAEAARLLVPGGRYGIHEICIQPESISMALRREIEAEMSREIHVGVQPLTLGEWEALFKTHGFKVFWCGSASMQLLAPSRILRDEGAIGTFRIGWRLAADSVMRARVRAMRRLFHKYRDYLGAISIVGAV